MGNLINGGYGPRHKNVQYDDAYKEWLGADIERSRYQTGVASWFINNAGSFAIGKLLSNTSETKDKTTSDSGSGTSISSNTDDAKRKELNRELNSALKNIGAKDENDINEAVARASKERDEKIAQQIKNGEAVVKAYDDRIADLNKQLDGEQDETNITALNKQIVKLKQEKENAEIKEEKALNKLKETEDKKLEEINKKADRALEVLEELAKLNKLDENEQVSVPEATEKLKEFNKYRNIMMTSTNKDNIIDAAKQLKKLHDDNPNDTSLTTAYNAIKNNVSACLQNDYDPNNDKSRAIKPNFGL